MIKSKYLIVIPQPEQKDNADKAEVVDGSL